MTTTGVPTHCVICGALGLLIEDPARLCLSRWLSSKPPTAPHWWMPRLKLTRDRFCSNRVGLYNLEAYHDDGDRGG